MLGLVSSSSLMSVDPLLVLPQRHRGELLEAGLGAEEAEPRLTDVGRVADPADLVGPHRTAVGQLEQRGRVGEVVAELADVLVEDPVPTVVLDADAPTR